MAKRCPLMLACRQYVKLIDARKAAFHRTRKLNREYARAAFVAAMDQEVAARQGVIDAAVQIMCDNASRECLKKIKATGRGGRR